MTVAFYSNIQASSPTNELHNICVCLHRVHSPSTGRTTSADFVHTHFEPFAFAFGRRLGLSGSLSSLSVVSFFFSRAMYLCPNWIALVRFVSRICKTVERLLGVRLRFHFHGHRDSSDLVTLHMDPSRLDGPHCQVPTGNSPQSLPMLIIQTSVLQGVPNISDPHQLHSMEKVKFPSASAMPSVLKFLVHPPLPLLQNSQL
jgi:hypothetical protein